MVMLGADAGGGTGVAASNGSGKKGKGSVASHALMDHKGEVRSLLLQAPRRAAPHRTAPQQ